MQMKEEKKVKGFKKINKVFSRILVKRMDF